MQPNKKATCSAIVLNYNHARFISRTLEAALQQTVPFDEILIFDDASTDNSIEVINQHIRGHSNVRLVRNEKNLGVVATCNLGVELATSDFVFYMSADDEYRTDILEHLQPVIEQYPDVAMIACNITMNNVDTGKERHLILPFPQVVARYSATDLAAVAKKTAFTFFGTNLIRRDAILQANNQLPALKWSSDWFLYLLIASRHPFAVVPKSFARIRQSSSQYSHAIFNWEQQRPVVESFVQALQNDYPESYPFFRQNAFLPSYDVRSLFLMLRHKRLRHYLTPLLVWRVLTYKTFRAVGLLLPDRARFMVRQLLRV